MNYNHNFNFPILNRRWCCFDTETTGVTQWDDVLQLTAIDSERKIVNEYFNGRRQKKWKKAESVHHISPGMVQDKENFYNRRNEFKELFKSYPVLVGYNVRFDISALAHGIYYKYEWYNAVIDVFHLWKEYKKKHEIETQDNKLTTVAKYFGYDFSDVAHDSLEDVYATIYVFKMILEKDAEIYQKCISVSKGELL